MEKLPLCRICLAENVRMYIVVNRNLHKLYEKLTDIPFVTEDSRPILACFFCCTKLKQCYRLLRQCLVAEELLVQRINEDYKPNPLINQNHLFSGFIKSPIEYISIDDEFETESTAIKEELPAVCEGLDIVIEPKEEHQSDELELGNLDNSCLNVADIPPHDSESDLEDDKPLMVLKTEVEYEDASKKKQRARYTKSATVAKKPKLDTQRTKLEDAITAEQMKKEKSESKVLRTTQKRTSKPGTYFKKPYKCDVCQRNFSCKGDLRNHIHTHTGEKPYKCDVCQRSFSHKCHLLIHTRKHTGEKPYECDVCQRRFSQKGDLSIHTRKHTGEKPYECDVCQRSFSRKGNLSIHTRIHVGEKAYKCDLCQHTFSQKINLTNHIRLHTGEKLYECHVCQHTFNRKFSLTNHIRVHTGEKPYKCDVCHCSFSQKNYLTDHIRVHTGVKPFKCNVCQRSFSQKSNLRKHIGIHTGKKPYKCDVCQRSFRVSSNLRDHIRIHTGVKPFDCNVCQRSFSTKSNLRRHIRIHTGEKP